MVKLSSCSGKEWSKNVSKSNGKNINVKKKMKKKIEKKKLLLQKIQTAVWFCRWGCERMLYSQTLSHYCSPRRLLAAGFPPWPGSPLLRKPGIRGLLLRFHVDDELSADAQSTRTDRKQSSQPQTIHQT